MDRAPGVGASTLDEQAVASRLGIDVQHVIEFARLNGLPKNGDHYLITPTYFDQIETWAKDQGYLSGGSTQGR